MHSSVDINVDLIDNKLHMAIIDFSWEEVLCVHSKTNMNKQR